MQQEKRKTTLKSTHTLTCLSPYVYAMAGQRANRTEALFVHSLACVQYKLEKNDRQFQGIDCSVCTAVR